MVKLRFWLLTAVPLVLLLVAGVKYMGAPQEGRLDQLRAVRLPADGQPLFQALMREIPDVVSQIPCACCGEPLSACYNGACPFT